MVTHTATPTTTAAAPGTRYTEHSVTVAAPPDRVYALIADVSCWPQIFTPTVHAEVAEKDGRESDGRESDGTGERILLWAFANGQVRHWSSRRTLDPAARTITFRQVASASPVASMGGEWRIEPNEDGGAHVVLLHDFRAEGDDPESVRLIGEAVDRNSQAELSALRNVAEQGPEPRAELHFTFHDSETVHGSAQDVYDFLDRAERWPDRLPHVARTTLTENEPGIQHLDMDTRSPDGKTHNTVSVRVCFPDRHELVYKQQRVPVALSGHTGRWTVEETAPGVVRATSWHTVTLDPEGVRHALGTDATFAEARDMVRHALGTNSSTTLRHAKAFAEAAAATAGGSTGEEGAGG